jgi:hypothetical protein
MLRSIEAAATTPKAVARHRTFDRASGAIALDAGQSLIAVCLPSQVVKGPMEQTRCGTDNYEEKNDPDCPPQK